VRRGESIEAIRSPPTPLVGWAPAVSICPTCAARSEPRRRRRSIHASRVGGGRLPAGRETVRVASPFEEEAESPGRAQLNDVVCGPREEKEENGLHLGRHGQ